MKYLSIILFDFFWYDAGLVKCSSLDIMQHCPEDFEPIRRTLFLCNTLVEYTEVSKLSINLTKILNACSDGSLPKRSQPSIKIHLSLKNLFSFDNTEIQIYFLH